MLLQLEHFQVGGRQLQSLRRFLHCERRSEGLQRISVDHRRMAPHGTSERAHRTGRDGDSVVTNIAVYQSDVELGSMTGYEIELDRRSYYRQCCLTAWEWREGRLTTSQFRFD